MKLRLGGSALLLFLCFACSSSPVREESDAEITTTHDAAPTCDGVAPTDGAGGVGSTLGGCPANEPGAGEACTIQGRLCTWIRPCAEAKTTDTGWCTAAGVWQVALGQCAKGCPTTASGALTECDDDGPCNANCTVGLTCYYPSTPLTLGISAECSESASGDASMWPSVPDSWNDCWVPAPASETPGSCTELAKCGGSAGCADSCPNAAPKDCGCGPDGHFYCQIGSGC